MERAKGRFGYGIIAAAIVIISIFSQHGWAGCIGGILPGLEDPHYKIEFTLLKTPSPGDQAISYEAVILPVVQLDLSGDTIRDAVANIGLIELTYYVCRPGGDGYEKIGPFSIRHAATTGPGHTMEIDVPCPGGGAFRYYDTVYLNWAFQPGSYPFPEDREIDPVDFESCTVRIGGRPSINVRVEPLMSDLPYPLSYGGESMDDWVNDSDFVIAGYPFRCIVSVPHPLEIDLPVDMVIDSDVSPDGTLLVEAESHMITLPEGEISHSEEIAAHPLEDIKWSPDLDEHRYVRINTRTNYACTDVADSERLEIVPEPWWCVPLEIEFGKPKDCPAVESGELNKNDSCDGFVVMPVELPHDIDIDITVIPPSTYYYKTVTIPAGKKKSEAFPVLAGHLTGTLKVRAYAEETGMKGERKLEVVSSWKCLD